MNYPQNETQLGSVLFDHTSLGLKVKPNNNRFSFESLKVNIFDIECPMNIQLQAASMSLTDTTPFYSQNYGERLAVRPKVARSTDGDESSKNIFVDIVKFALV